MKIYNTMTRKKEEFVPLHEGKVGIYSCGPTVYNYFHIGNARPFIIFDTLRRHLEHMGYEVTFVQNFTDVDDKMIRRANEEGVTVAELGDRFIEEYFRDADALGVKRATVHPRATKHIGEIIGMIKKLEAKGLIRRMRSIEDRRVVNVVLTAKGRAAYEYHKAFHERMIASVLDTLSPEQTAILAQSFEKLQDFFRQEEAAMGEEADG